MRNKLIEELKKYTPYNEQEEMDRALILNMLQSEENIYSRDCAHAHMTVSAWIVNKERTKTIMAYHNIYKSWSWLGGHADGNEDLLAVAIQEVKEEAGVKNVVPVSEEIFSVEVLTVDGHVKKGKYVSSHLHLNITYLLEADEADALSIKEDENSDVSWFTFADAVNSSNEEWFKERIYSKLIEKVENSR